MGLVNARAHLLDCRVRRLGLNTLLVLARVLHWRVESVRVRLELFEWPNLLADLLNLRDDL